MSEPIQTQSTPPVTAPSAAIMDSRSAPNLMGALLAGGVAALAGAVLWAVVTVMLKAQIGFMAIGVGLLVAFSVRALGKGSAPTYGVIGAVFALLGCVIGNLLSGCAFVALQENLPITDVTLRVLSSPSTSVLLLQESFDPMDLLFYGIAAYEGFKFARVTHMPAATAA
jgi:hypothetical protein